MANDLGQQMQELSDFVKSQSSVGSTRQHHNLVTSLCLQIASVPSMSAKDAEKLSALASQSAFIEIDKGRIAAAIADRLNETSKKITGKAKPTQTLLSPWNYMTEAMAYSHSFPTRLPGRGCSHDDVFELLPFRRAAKEPKQ